MNIDWIQKIDVTAMISMAFAISTTLMTMFFLLKKRQENLDLQIARMSVERDYFERTSKDMIDKLVRDEGRWKELNHLVLESIQAQSKIIDSKIHKKLAQPEILSPRPFLKSLGIELDEVKTRNDEVFVLTPFSSRYMSDYEVIAQTCRSVGLSARRGDEEFIAGGILPHIVRKIVASKFIIANIDGRNANVFYELGLAQAFGKMVIIVSRHSADLPFDVKQQQIVLYENGLELQIKLKESMVRLLANSKNIELN